MNEKMKNWETKEGVKFLRKIGIISGQSVLDFGCRVGHYTIPAAKIVANDGAVYAVDKEQEALSVLQQKVKANNLKNVKIMKTTGQTNLDFESESICVVLLYDVLHYLEKTDRKKLYEESFRILEQYGLLSVYPKHMLGDDPIRQFKELNSDDIKQEIEDSGFHFEEKHCGFISHDDGLNQGCIFNFRKAKK
jgi:ubiquinone/menaquinone biosynthesis C-methylase UbiE